MTPSPGLTRRTLQELAVLHGLQTSFRDVNGVRRSASDQALVGTLRALGVDLDGPAGAAEALREARRSKWGRPLEPVLVAPRGRLAGVVRLPRRMADAPLRWYVVLESSEERRPAGPAPDRAATRAEVDGVEFVERGFAISDRLPPGYHDLILTAGHFGAQSRVISTPAAGKEDDGRRGWGVFLPLHALRSARSWGVGDLTDLGDLAEWTGSLGGEVTATLPLLAAFLDQPFDPSPYSPASRLFWNELFIDVTRVPEAVGSWEARRLTRSHAFRQRVGRLRDAELTDYRPAMAVKRAALEAAAGAFFAMPEGPRWEAFRSFLAWNPGLEHYARFRAACEVQGAPWTEWPKRHRDGHLPPAGGDQGAFRYHQYAQWVASEQMDQLAVRARDAGVSLSFDLPLGVHPAGYDVWRHREAFALEATAGAPPDPFFTKGQDWGIFPLHPRRIREQAYRYPIACVRHALRHAGVVRIDHVMGLHRLYWVPEGLEATDGVYVRYRPEELYAILQVEAGRVGATVVGEDLGTVQAEVRTAMARHRVHRTFVVPFELTGEPARAIRPAPRLSFVSMNTHDMSPFAGFWRAKDVALRLAQGWLTEIDARREVADRRRLLDALVAFLRARGLLPPGRAPTVRQALTACLSHLAGGDARMMVVNLEDLWLETEPQNVPGTVEAYPNWRRTARYPFERFSSMSQVTSTLRRIDAIRKGTTHT